MGMSIGSIAGKAFVAVQPIMDYSSSRKEGHGVVRSAAFAAIDTALWTMPETVPFMMAKQAFDVSKMALGVGIQVGRHNADNVNKVYNNRFGGNYQESQGAYTMRQRGVQAIQGSGMNVRSVLGSEARSYYRSSGYR